MSDMKLLRYILFYYTCDRQENMENISNITDVIFNFCSTFLVVMWMTIIHLMIINKNPIRFMMWYDAKNQPATPKFYTYTQANDIFVFYLSTTPQHNMYLRDIQWRMTDHVLYFLFLFVSCFASLAWGREAGRIQPEIQAVAV